MFEVARLKFNGEGLVPVVAQDVFTGDVLMLAWANREALEASQRTGLMHYHSRSRGRLWQKGEESGHVQHVKSLHADCDGDAVLALVVQDGPACHKATPTCFGEETPTHAVAGLSNVIEARRKVPPAGSYTARLLADANLRTKKVGEEATELVMALQGESEERVASEAADVIYHLMVATAARGVAWRRVVAELEKRRK